MARTAFIGAGSTVFGRNLSGDLLAIPELTGSGTRPASRART
jgi:alpha-galactosidase/6-phospho-beta-glucosidase family protein